ncbi:unnamed protein product [Adineta steineri]|uniref:Uncharacterized protein n=1 Tax=Adineta steineri TaxID=433720 RepID=A0A815LQH8_9BILA|nr:unnamed protein product [Adineta steineri]CAF1617761.1 unnamed protein product [Adineta steineri]
MYDGSLLPPEIAGIFDRFSKDELHQIGRTLIEQTQNYVDKQQDTRASHLFRPPLHTHTTSRPTQQSNLSIPPPMNHQQRYNHQASSIVHPLMDQQGPPIDISTPNPRRPAGDSFDYSGDKNRNNVKRFRNIEQSPSVQQQHQPHQPSYRRFNINTLKRAVASNLPSFFITFDLSSSSVKSISNTQVAILLKKVLADNTCSIKELSMCMQAGTNRFKFAVNNKADFLKMFNFNWPNEIEDYKVEVIRPRSLPECFSLVVRYIPVTITEELAKVEIMKAIPTAVAFSTIKYQRQRPTYDIRFSVPNIDHYDTAIELGRIAIGHHYLPLTHFYMGYRLTYCTACWKIDHSRNQCQAPVCCRKCLEPYESEVKHICSENNLQCAQCGEAHFSLDPACPIIQNYKSELKRAVDDALMKGTIKRTAPGETSEQFNRQGDDFPVLIANEGGGPGWHPAPTSTSQLNQSQLNFIKEVIELGKLIKSLTDSMNRIESKIAMIDKRIELVENRSTLHSNSIATIIDSIQILNKWVLAEQKEKAKFKIKIGNITDELHIWRRKIKEDGREECSVSTSPHQSIATAPANNINNKNNGETELKKNQSTSAPNDGK